jgi:MFS family permease
VWHRIYYGWIMLVAVAVAQVVSWGILYYAFSVLVTPMQAELGWTTPTLTGAYSVALLLSGLAAVPVGRWVDRHGARAVMTGGSCMGTLLLLGWSQVSSIVGFYLLMAGVGVVMATVLYEPAFAMIAVWFRRLRSRALTVLTFFGAWASVIFIPLSDRLVGAVGWRTAILVLAALLASITIPVHALVVRRRPQDVGSLPDGTTASDDQMTPLPAERSLSLRTALHDADFWWLTTTFAASTFASVALTVHLIPYLVSTGMAARQAATILGLFGIMSLGGRLVLGPLGERYQRRRVTALLVGMQLIGVLILLGQPTVVGAVAFITLFGAGSGTLTIMRAALLADRYGAAQYGSISGAQNLVLTVARTLAPVTAALVATQTGGYRTVLWLLVALTAGGGVAVLQITDGTAVSARAQAAGQ